MASCLNEADDDIGCVITFCDAGSTKLGHNSRTKEVTTAIITTEWILLKDQKKGLECYFTHPPQSCGKSQMRRFSHVCGASELNHVS